MPTDSVCTAITASKLKLSRLASPPHTAKQNFLLCDPDARVTFSVRGLTRLQRVDKRREHCAWYLVRALFLKDDSTKTGPKRPVQCVRYPNGFLTDGARYLPLYVRGHGM